MGFVARSHSCHPEAGTEPRSSPIVIVFVGADPSVIPNDGVTSLLPYPRETKERELLDVQEKLTEKESQLNSFYRSIFRRFRNSVLSI